MIRFPGPIFGTGGQKLLPVQDFSIVFPICLPIMEISKTLKLPGKKEIHFSS